MLKYFSSSLPGLTDDTDNHGSDEGYKTKENGVEERNGRVTFRKESVIEEKIQGFRFRDISNNYLEEVLKNNRTKQGRTIWFVLFLGMAAICFYISYLLLSHFFQYESYNLEFSQLANSYTLPAITICNLNILNYTEMIEKGKETNQDIYGEYKTWNANVGKRDPNSTEEKDENSTWIGNEEMYTKYKMEIRDAVVSDLTTFAKEVKDHNDFTSHAYTSSGFCLEMNDNAELVQRVNGAIGGMW